VNPVRIAGIILGAIAAVLLGFLFIGFLLPSEWSTERSALVPAPPDSVFPYLESAEAWSLWTPSPETGVVLFGPETGPGSGRRWDDPGYGRGEFVIVDMERPRFVEYEVAVEGGAIRITGHISLSPTGEGTRITWRERGDFGWNPLLGYLAGRMDELQGGQLEVSLDVLRRLLAPRQAEGATPEPT
jgi:uncharacterized protein YndB with AHSA1/START domain